MIISNTTPKIYIFDLDHTLLLHKTTPAYRSMYETQLRIFLDHLLKNNKILGIASFNMMPHAVLEELKISHYFNPNLVIGEQSEKNKFCMIMELLDKTRLEKHDCVFYDDLYENVYHCELNGITSILVNPLKGIEFDKYI